MKLGMIKIKKFVPAHLGPVSYDLTIHSKVRKISHPNGASIDCTKPKNVGMFTELPVYLNYGESIVFTTDEKITLCDSITGIIYQRSSLTKLPLLFCMAGLVDPGFSGSITGTVYNFSCTEVLIKKMRICQIVFHEHVRVKIPYNKRNLSKNQNQYGIESLISKQDLEFRDS